MDRVHCVSQTAPKGCFAAPGGAAEAQPTENLRNVQLSLIRCGTKSRGISSNLQRHLHNPSSCKAKLKLQGRTALMSVALADTQCNNSDHAHCRSGRSGTLGVRSPESPTELPRRLGGQEVSQERATLGPLLANLPRSKRGHWDLTAGQSSQGDHTLRGGPWFQTCVFLVWTLVEQLLLNSRDPRCFQGGPLFLVLCSFFLVPFFFFIFFFNFFFIFLFFF